MTSRVSHLREAVLSPSASVLVLVLLILQAWSGLGGVPLHAQSSVPKDQIHVSVTLGGYILLGVGYTRWIEQHHALEFTLFPLAHPSEGFPFGLRAGHAWIPSNERWRAKLGGNVTVLIRPVESSRSRFTPILAFTPGLHYQPSDSRTLRADVWMSWFLTEKVFAPSGVEILSGWNR
jgi:hypothetical protein